MQKQTPPLLLLAISLVLAGCEPTAQKGTGSDRGADGIALDYLEHRAAGRTEAAYELVSAEDRAAVTHPQDDHPQDHQPQHHQPQDDSTTREVDSATFGDDLTTVTLVVTESYPGLDEGDAPTVRERTLYMVKEDGAWRVDTDWAEEKELEAELARRRRKKDKIASLAAESDALRRAGKMQEAKSKLEEALAMKPADPTIHDRLVTIEHMIDATVAGRWYKSPQDSPTSATVNIHSSNALERLGGELQSGKLEVHCRYGEVGASLHISPAKLRTRTTERTASLQIRLDDQAPTELTVSAKRHDPLPVQDPRAFLDAIAGADRLVVQAEASNFADKQQWTYDVEGAAEAFALVYDTCGPDE